MDITKFSTIGKLNLLDAGKAAIVTAITVALSAVYAGIEAGTMPTIEQWKSAAVMGLTAGVAYIIKQLLTGLPDAIAIDPTKTAVIDAKTKQVIAPKKVVFPKAN